MPAPLLTHPRTIDDLFLYRISRLLVTGGAQVIRLCEGTFGITRREWRILALLAQGDGLLSSELAGRAQLDRARTSRAVTVLAAKQLVSRNPRPVDTLVQAQARLGGARGDRRGGGRVRRR